jgi:hypothetical protein
LGAEKQIKTEIMNTLKNIRIIARFMEWKNIVNDGAIQLYKKGDATIHLSNLKYDSDWNWLMEVVEKIESLGYYFRFLGNGWIIIVNLSEKETIEIHDKCKITACYNACLEFIKWYNENSAKEE